MLDNLKLLLGIDLTDTDRDDLLKLIISNTTARLKIFLGGIDPPEDLDHIIIDVAISRYNRIGSEGLSSHTVEGESQSFTENDFDEFTDEIQAYLDSLSTSSRGKVRFL